MSTAGQAAGGIVGAIVGALTPIGPLYAASIPAAIGRFIAAADPESEAQSSREVPA